MARWLPGATAPHLAWMYTASETPPCISCVILESITLDRTWHRVLFGQTCIVCTSNTWTLNRWQVPKTQCSFSKESPFTFNKMRGGGLPATNGQPRRSALNLHFPDTSRGAIRGWDKCWPLRLGSLHLRSYPLKTSGKCPPKCQGLNFMCFQDFRESCVAIPQLQRL